MNLFSLTQTYRSITRLREIALILSKHGFNQMIETVGLGRFLPLSRRFAGRGGTRGDTPLSLQIRMAMEDLGPTFVKLGQMLSSRPDLVPQEFAEEFKKLRDDVPPFPFSDVQRIIEQETGSPLAEAFSRVDPDPLAAASIAQVHRAVLGDGSPVALKVQRPGIDRTVSQDLAVLYLMVNLADRYLPELRPFDLRGIADEFARTIRKELDFFLEASNTERFRKNFADVKEVLVPGVRWEFTTKRLLVLDLIEGNRADDPAVLEAQGHDPRRIAQIGVRAFLKQVFDDGLFHGDLHAGNLLVTPDGRVAFLDFGAVGYLSEESQDSLGRIFLALIGRDYAGMADGYLRMGAVDESVNLRAFDRDLRELIEPYYGRPLKDLRLGEILRETAQIALRHRIRVPPELILLARSALTIEGLGRILDPDFLILEEAAPYARKLLARRLDPRHQARMLYRSVRDIGDFARAAPTQLSRIFQKIVEGRLAIDFVHRGYEPALNEMDRSSNRLSFSLIISALIIGSALIVLSGKGPHVWDFPVFGILGFILAGVLGLGLAIAILRSGKI